MVFPWQLRLMPASEGTMFAEWFDLWLSLVLPIRTAPVRDRLAGSLIGQCLGDAVGFVVEGYSREICQEYVDEILLTDKAGTIGRSPHAFGQYTDDSQLARTLVESYVACRGFDPGDYARRIAELFTDQRVVGRGRASTAAAIRLAQGVPWQEAGVPAPYAGNGAAMRAAPIGWMFPYRPDAMIQAARDQARITHTDPRAVAGSVVIAGAVALAMRASPGRLKRDAVIDTLARWIRPIEPSFATDLEQLHALLNRDPADAHWLISRAGRKPGDIETGTDRWPSTNDTISAYVVPSVMWSLYSFLRAPEDYWQAVCLAVSGGGDTDTTAAMTGAISGAYLGLSAIPRPLAVRLDDCGTWNFDALCSLVEAFAATRSRS
jgi:ADP-ribosylglycohydrolase